MVRVISKQALKAYIKQVPLNQRPPQWRSMTGRNAASLLRMAEEIGAVPRRSFRTRVVSAAQRNRFMAVRRAAPPRTAQQRRRNYPLPTPNQVRAAVTTVGSRDITSRGKMAHSLGQWVSNPQRYDLAEMMDDGQYSARQIKDMVKSRGKPLSRMVNGRRRAYTVAENYQRLFKDFHG